MGDKESMLCSHGSEGSEPILCQPCAMTQNFPS